MKRLLLRIILCVIGIEVLGGLGAFVTSGEISGWYRTLAPPPGTPPNWVFGPVWTALYAMMGVALALLWDAKPASAARSCAFRWFGIQLGLNLIWTPVFFGLHQLEAALVIIVMLIAAIILCQRALARVSKVAAWLLTPYLLWVCYATYLNAGFVALN